MELRIAPEDIEVGVAKTPSIRYSVQWGDVPLFTTYNHRDYGFLQCFNWASERMTMSGGKVTLAPPAIEHFSSVLYMEVCRECHTPSITWDEGSKWSTELMEMEPGTGDGGDYSYCSHCDSENRSESVRIGYMDVDIASRLMMLTGVSGERLSPDEVLEDWKTQDTHFAECVKEYRVWRGQVHGRPKTSKWGDDYEAYAEVGAAMKKYFLKHYSETELWLTFPNVRRAS